MKHRKSNYCVLNHKNLQFYLKKSNKCTIFLYFLSSRIRYRSSIFFAAPATGFFSSTGSDSKDPKTPGSDQLQLPSPGCKPCGRPCFTRTKAEINVLPVARQTTCRPGLSGATYSKKNKINKRIDIFILCVCYLL